MEEYKTSPIGLVYSLPFETRPLRPYSDASLSKFITALNFSSIEAFLGTFFNASFTAGQSLLSLILPPTSILDSFSKYSLKNFSNSPSLFKILYISLFGDPVFPSLPICFLTLTMVVLLVFNLAAISEVDKPLSIKSETCF